MENAQHYIVLRSSQSWPQWYYKGSRSIFTCQRHTRLFISPELSQQRNCVLKLPRSWVSFFCYYTRLTLYYDRNQDKPIVVSLLQVYLLCVAVCLPCMMDIARSGIHPITLSTLMRQQDWSFSIAWGIPLLSLFASIFPSQFGTTAFPIGFC